ncbi:MAG: ParB-like nuclease domain-containing protein [Methanobrevibacter sp.]|nr:ParB-like nuclease domain-containing protein [Methanosphaera sp.]MBR0371033.1 ParB-like nuclease domain-containing protein [Methanobrevibacter sp.]
MIDELINELTIAINDIDDVDEKIKIINKLNQAVNEVNPLKEPICNVQYVKGENVHANEYNPNHVATPEMELLYNSIKLDGYTQPIVAYKINDSEYEIVDGFHRNRVGKEHEDITMRLHGYLPLTVIDKPLDERMGSTIRHNRARGSHQIRSMSEIVLDLSKSGWSDEEISTKLGMDMDEVLRLKQITGLKEAFQNHTFSKSWVEFEAKLNEQIH